MSYQYLSEAVAAFNDAINESTDWPVVLGISITPSDALDAADPIAYKTYFFDWCDSEGIDADDLEDDYNFTRDSM